MPIDISARFSFHLHKPTDLLLQFEAAEVPGQILHSANTQLGAAVHLSRVPAHESIGERLWLHADGDCSVEYRAQVTVNRPATDLAALSSIPAHKLPGGAVEYLFYSRYCQADRLHGFVETHFGEHEGGAKIAAMRDWIAREIAYVPGSSTSNTTALDSFTERQGICRDFAHVLIAFARAATIPARYVSCYAPGVEPPDFHAVAEVFLADPETPGNGAWYLVDPTGMSDPGNTVIIGIGRDATDVSFMTVFGIAEYGEHVVEVCFSD